ncbi:phosphoglycerate dehydrogenase [Crocinitomicaceae bacterium]|jgi:D-3-phosphoglycerate dehydrogenase / 2-oxoglutarate reductase|nr:phosphoglycerate dehydrogenase [Crocinitomicaceae bacterium]
MQILFLDEVHPILEDRLTLAGHQCIQAIEATIEETKRLVENVDGIVIRARFKLDKEILEYAQRLKFIARSGAGMENIDIPYCEKRGITLHNAPEGNRNAVGEHALGMLLSLLNHLNKGDKEVRSGKWDREGNRGEELDGKTIGIIGFGNNGQAFAKKLRGFDVNVLAYDKYKTNFGNEFIKESSLEELYKNADVISFHIPQNEETIFMGNSVFFKNFLKPIFVLNLSRGKIIETKALVDALKKGRVKAAGLDVLEYEKSSFESFFEQTLPPAFQYLLNAENVILSPHVGGWTKESYFKLSDVLADKILGV